VVIAQAVHESGYGLEAKQGKLANSHQAYEGPENQELHHANPAAWGILWVVFRR
jgi:hypothetical protein